MKRNTVSTLLSIFLVGGAALNLAACSLGVKAQPTDGEPTVAAAPADGQPDDNEPTGQPEEKPAEQPSDETSQPVVKVDQEGVSAPGVTINSDGVQAPGVTVSSDGVKAPGMTVGPEGVQVGGISVSSEGVEMPGISVGNGGVSVDFSKLPLGDLTENDAATTECSDDMQITQDGAAMVLSGHCGTLTISGDNVNVVLQSADKIVVNGSDCELVTQAASSMVVNGNSNVMVVAGTLDSLEIQGDENEIAAKKIVNPVQDSGEGNTVA